MKRTVVPVLIVSLLGANAAWDVPLPVILTSTTAPAGSVLAGAADGAARGGVAGSARYAAHFLSPPLDAAPKATRPASRGNRYPDSLPVRLRERVLVNLLKL